MPLPALPFLPLCATSDQPTCSSVSHSFLVQVVHGIPLTQYQKSQLAERITVLHSTEYLTPSLFVNVHYIRAEPVGDFFLAGKLYNSGKTSPNRIMGTVRTGPARTKERFDNFAQKLQDAWYEVVNGPKEAGVETNGHAAAVSKEDRKARKLHLVGFGGVIAGIENGVVLPSVSFFSPPPLPRSIFRSSPFPAPLNTMLFLPFH